MKIRMSLQQFKLTIHFVFEEVILPFFTLNTRQTVCTLNPSYILNGNYKIYFSKVMLEKTFVLFFYLYCKNSLIYKSCQV